MLAADPQNQQALVMLLLALTDQFDESESGVVGRARDVAPRLRDEYERAYYAGHHRRAPRQGPAQAGRARLQLRGLRRRSATRMALYEKAEALRPAGNDDAILRWNTCARILERHPDLTEAPQEEAEQPLE